MNTASATTWIWLHPCRVCGAWGELRPCGGDPLLFCEECAEWTIGDVSDWGEWTAYWERSITK